VARGNVHLRGAIHVPLDKLDAMKQHLDLHTQLSRAEDGCLKFIVAPDPDTAGRFAVHEIFEDQTAFDAHQARVRDSDWGVFSAGFLRVYTSWTEE